MAAWSTALHPYATDVTCVQVMGEDVSQLSPNRSVELARVMAEMQGGLRYYRVHPRGLMIRRSRSGFSVAPATINDTHFGRTYLELRPAQAKA